MRVATTANVTIATALNAGDSIDGVTLAAGDRVLVKDQSTGSQNGIYVAGASPARAYDMDQDGTTTVPAEEIAGAFVYVIAGTANAGKVFHTTNVAGGTLGSTTITWTEFSGGGGGAPTTVDYLVGTADGTLSNEIVVGTTPGGELGGTWASPTVDTTHSGSAHTDFIAKSLAAAKGDLFTATANDTPAIQTVGANDTILMADSGQTNGLKWVASQTPTTAVFADTAAEGTADTYARGDHKHGMPNAPTPGTDADGYTVIIASSNEDITNQQYQNHSEFSFSCTSGKHYSVIIDLVYSGSDATGDYGCRFAVDAGTMKGRGAGFGLDGGLSPAAISTAVTAGATTGNVQLGTPADVDLPQHVQLDYAFTPTNTTTFRYTFGNFSASGGRISRTWAGSIMKWKQLD